MTDSVTIKFTWENSLPIFLACLESGTYEGQRSAETQLRHMAWLADNAFKPLEIGIYPMQTLPNGDQTLAQSPEEVAHYAVDVRPSGSDPIYEADDLTEEEAEALVLRLEEHYPQASINDLRDLL